MAPKGGKGGGRMKRRKVCTFLQRSVPAAKATATSTGIHVSANSLSTNRMMARLTSAITAPNPKSAS